MSAKRIGSILPARRTIQFDRMVQMSRMLQVMRTIDKTRTADSPAAAAAGSPVDGRELVERIMDEFHVAMRELRCAGTERLVKAGVSMTHLHVMGLLSRHGETSMSRIADLLDVSLSNATGLIDRMAERGLVERVRVPDDRRVVLVRLSEGGQAQLDELEVLRRDLLQKILGRLDATQLKRLSQSLSDVHGAVAGLIESEGPDAFGTSHDHVHGHAHVHSHAAGHPGAPGLDHPVAL
jgi:DNA-binding MarR family transcriptional regulator